MGLRIQQVWTTGSYALRTLCALHVFHTYVYEFTATRGESMLPTLGSSNDYVHVLKRCRNGRDCGLGDCIVAAKPTDPFHRVCKRITGMPGDMILVDPSQDDVTDETFDSFIKVPKGHVWVTGDNLEHSLDSRSYNSIPMALIKGKIVAANDFNEPFWGGSKGNFWGFRFLANSYTDQ